MPCLPVWFLLFLYIDEKEFPYYKIYYINQFYIFITKGELIYLFRSRLGRRQFLSVLSA
jgi:hypothetical protein